MDKLYSKTTKPKPIILKLYTLEGPYKSRFKVRWGKIRQCLFKDKSKQPIQLVKSLQQHLNYIYDIDKK